MANYKKRNKKNAEGPLFVDQACIDCGTCFHIAPMLFKEDEKLSIVSKVPTTLLEWSLAKEAVASCPTNAIGVQNAPLEYKSAMIALPKLIADHIYYCGYTSPDTFGGSSYFLQSKTANILIDSPRFNNQLVLELEKLGGVDYMFLSHQDDVGDHQKFSDHFGCDRIIHVNDQVAGLENCEIVLKGSENFALTPDHLIIPTPGHTKGHMVLYYKGQYLFSGDHLFYDTDKEKVYASKLMNWYSWSEQKESIKKLLDISFDWLFPGHGGWVNKDRCLMRKDLEELIE